MQRDYAMVTNLMQVESFPVLEDWLDFMPYPPRTLICFCGANEDAKILLRDLAARVGLTLIIAPEELTDDIRKYETKVLEWQFDQVEEDFCLRVTLDTLSYRTTTTDWLNRTIDILERDDLLYATGSTRLFRTDTPHGDMSNEEPHLFLTRRISFNFVIIRPETWLDLYRGHPDPQGAYGRYSIEGVVEHHCRDSGRYGLRLANSPEWRVFHVQVWDERINAIRTAFRDNTKVGRFLNGYEDGRRHPWEKYFMYPAPSLLRRFRIGAGRLRRQIFSK